MLALLLAVCCAGRAAADQPKRPLPDYDGRSDPTTAGDVLIWVPRVLMSPLYLVSEYVVRRPLGFLVSAAERAQLPSALYELFTFGPDHRAGLLPIAFVDFGFYPSVGLYFFWNDALVPHHDLRIRASTWGADWLAASWTDRFHLDARTDVVFQAVGIRRPDYRFYGLGSTAPDADRSRYGASRLDANLSIDSRFQELSHVVSTFGARSVSFHRGEFGHEPELEERVAAGRFELPDGYERGYTVLYERLQLIIDSRRARPESGSGVRVVTSVEQLSDVRRAPGAGMLRYGMNAGGFWDIGDHGRVVSLSLAAAFADPLGRSPVPFTELASIGGEESMRGFPAGRLYGRSNAVATLRYRWPIWVWLDGSLQFALGNVFDAQLAGFKPRLLRFSGALGIESVGSPDSSLEILIGLGSETFAQGGQISSVRFVVGTNHGF